MTTIHDLYQQMQNALDAMLAAQEAFDSAPILDRAAQRQALSDAHAAFEAADAAYYGALEARPGRPVLDVSSPTVMVSVRMTEHQRLAFRALGGSQWLRSRIDDALDAALALCADPGHGQPSRPPAAPVDGLRSEG